MRSVISMSADDDIGELIWFPPAQLQERLDEMPPEGRQALEGLMFRMIEGYLRAMIDSQHSIHTIRWFFEQTTNLVREASSRVEPPAKSLWKQNSG